MELFMSDKTSLHYYVNMPGNTLPGTSFSTITEALTALTDSSCLSCEKQFPAPVSDLPPVIVHIGEGIYREKIIITRPNVTFEGAGADKTILVYGDAALDLMPDGDKRGTFRTASVRIDTHDFTAKHLTFQNDSGFGHTVGQALAVYVDGDRNAFYDCRFLGSQDTVFDAPLPLKEAQPGGFKGPGEFKPRTIGRHYYENCFMEYALFVSLRMGKYANGIGTGLERDGKELVRHQRGIESKDKRI